MATGKTDSSIMFGGSKLSSLEDDFTHGVTVAQTNIKIRLGLYFEVFILYFKPQKAVHVTLIRNLGSFKSKVSLINVRNGFASSNCFVKVRFKSSTILAQFKIPIRGRILHLQMFCNV